MDRQCLKASLFVSPQHPATRQSTCVQAQCRLNCTHFHILLPDHRGPTCYYRQSEIQSPVPRPHWYSVLFPTTGTLQTELLPTRGGQEVPGTRDREWVSWILRRYLGPLLLTWNDVNPNMDNKSYVWQLLIHAQTSTAEIWEWMINSITRSVMGVITYPYK